MNTHGSMIAEIKSTTKATRSPTGSFEATLSTSALDRDREIVDRNAFAPLPDHITIDLDHSMTVEKTVGSGRPFYDESGVLKFAGTYASTPLAQMTRTLVDEGHIRTMSVAYMNALYELGDDGVQHMRRAELLNAGIVGIPANREALITASKALADQSAVLRSGDQSQSMSHNHYIVGESGSEHVHVASGGFISSDLNKSPCVAPALSATDPAQAASVPASGPSIREWVDLRIDALLID